VQNAVKHSHADQIEINLAKDKEDIVLRIADNGVGIDEKHVSGTGMGIRIMTYRAGLIGATFDESLYAARSLRAGAEGTSTSGNARTK
jgi:signal transduction histidine kinase